MRKFLSPPSIRSLVSGLAGRGPEKAPNCSLEPLLCSSQQKFALWGKVHGKRQRKVCGRRLQLCLEKVEKMKMDSQEALQDGWSGAGEVAQQEGMLTAC